MHPAHILLARRSLRRFLPIILFVLPTLLASSVYARLVHGATSQPVPVIPAADDPPPVRRSVVLELAGPPAAEIYAASRSAQIGAEIDTEGVAAATQAHLATLEAAQQEVLAALEGFDADLLYRAQRVYNGIALSARTEDLDALAALPGVVAVHPIIAKRPLPADSDPADSNPANYISVPYIGAAALWQEYGLTGQGIKIAIIDTGIDYLHLDFGGPGTGYADNDATVIGDVPSFPGAKVVGGWDFVGEIYNADPKDADYQPAPQPDPDPFDCYGSGHGTHVAGTAAGFGVTESGMTYNGPYSDTLPTFRIGPGVAPHALLYALKIFGCTGSTDLVDAAVEWAVDPNGDGDFSDRVDVINLSVGSTAGSPYDSTTIAVENAVKIGVLVVASAGNDGDSFYAASSPGVAGRALSVAAIIENGEFDGNSDLPESLTGFSARGPRRGDAALKPEIAAPGFLIISAQARSGDGATFASGTSMAAPHVAGALALLREKYPDPGLPGGAEDASLWTSPIWNGPIWNGEDLKALLMNTARRTLFFGSEGVYTPYSPVRAGAGRIDLRRALQTQVIAYSGGDPGLVSLSFGAPEVLDTLSLVREVRVANKGEVTATYTLSYTPITEIPGVAILLPEGPITVPPHDIVTFPISLTASAKEMRHTRDATLPLGSTYPLHWMAESAGYLLLLPEAPSQDIGQTLHLPVYAAPRPAAQMTALIGASEPLSITVAQVTLPITLSGVALIGTAVPTEVRSLASVFELRYRSRNHRPPQGFSDAATDHADLQFVGVATDRRGAKNHPAAPATVAASRVYFGLATHAPWSTPSEVRFSIFIDTNLDRVYDYRLFSADDKSYATNEGISDVFITALENLRTGEIVAHEFLNVLSPSVASSAIYNTNVLVLPLRASAIGLSQAQSRFNFYVESYSKDISGSLELGTFVERTPVFSYDVRRPGIDLSGGLNGAPLYHDVNGSVIRAGFRVADFFAAGQPELLVFHHHNVGERRTQVIGVDAKWPAELFLPRFGRRGKG